LDLLKDLLERIAAHDAQRPPRETAIVLLGDLIDRGPDSRGVVEFVRTLRPAYARVFLIAGNHEELLLRALERDDGSLQIWIASGGDTTLRSYGVPFASLEGIGLAEIFRRVGTAIPADHVSFLRSAADSIRCGDYVFVHAGVRPGVALAAQTTNDLRWIRRPFLQSELDHGFLVVHGHSTRTEIEEKKSRIGIDTGAYRSGVLTALWIEDDARGFLQAVGAPDESWTSILE